MVDNRNAGFFGIGGGFNFKSGDVSGTAAKTSDEKNDQGTQYFQMRRGEGEQNFDLDNFYVDRSAQLNASLDSLASINAPSVKVQKIKDKLKNKNKKKKSAKELLNEENEFEKE